ncbi:hypothetical protein [Nocardioides mangrovicus]|uniref:hypothetical protein n=1 Tax=Nocardioides mangrovicus TaxID=2478913 RepID=UPI0013147FB6|nr:hypothetical protein [Nocardioides mangrovicus]
MALRLSCPCGARLFGRTGDDLVTEVRLHLEADHASRQYQDDEILSMAVPIPDRLLP